MALRCEYQGCHRTRDGGYMFYQCDRCKRLICLKHCYHHGKCPLCEKGIMRSL
jgi:hypothetical protein